LRRVNLVHEILDVFPTLGRPIPFAIRVALNQKNIPAGLGEAPDDGRCAVLPARMASVLAVVPEQDARRAHRPALRAVLELPLGPVAGVWCRRPEMAVHQCPVSLRFRCEIGCERSDEQEYDNRPSAAVECGYCSSSTGALCLETSCAWVCGGTGA